MSPILPHHSLTPYTIWLSPRPGLEKLSVATVCTFSAWKWLEANSGNSPWNLERNRVWKKRGVRTEQGVLTLSNTLLWSFSHHLPRGLPSPDSSSSRLLAATYSYVSAFLFILQHALASYSHFHICAHPPSAFPWTHTFTQAQSAGRGGWKKFVTRVAQTGAGYDCLAAKSLGVHLPTAACCPPIVRQTSIWRTAAQAAHKFSLQATTWAELIFSAIMCEKFSFQGLLRAFVVSA